MTIFDRKNPEVIKDGSTLTSVEFVKKYSNISDIRVLLSVYKNINKNKETQTNVATIAETSTDFVEVEAIEEVEIIDSPEKLKAFADKKPKVVKEKIVEKEEIEEGDKKGRTPAMRELIKIHGKDDKSKIKRLLIEDGFNCESLGFHSEWRRITK
jgi:hypothetical protein